MKARHRDQTRKTDGVSHLGGHRDVTHIDMGALMWLVQHLGVRSMIDVGCGPGGMVALAKCMGLEAIGVDGDPRVRVLGRHVAEHLIVHDFRQGPLDLGRRFDLAWSCEFLEHVEEEYQPNYFDLFRSAKHVFCTAARPGKHGHHHVNCRDLAYWMDMFELNGFVFDEQLTAGVRAASTMAREFVRETGMCFRRCDAVPVHDTNVRKRR